MENSLTFFDLLAKIQPEVFKTAKLMFDLSKRQLLEKISLMENQSDKMDLFDEELLNTKAFLETNFATFTLSLLDTPVDNLGNQTNAGELDVANLGVFTISLFKNLFQNLEKDEKTVEGNKMLENLMPLTIDTDNEALKNKMMLNQSVSKNFEIYFKREYYRFLETERKNILNDEKQKNIQPTLQQQILMIRLIFEELGVKNVDNTAKARFVQFLTGKELGASEIKNTDIYKKMRQDTDTSEVKDLKVILKFFKDLKITSIVEKINQEIG